MKTLFATLVVFLTIVSFAALVLWFVAAFIRCIDIVDFLYVGTFATFFYYGARSIIKDYNKMNCA